MQGHRDGHGFVQRDDGEPDLYLPHSEMRAVWHGDKVRARVGRLDRKGRAEGKVTEIIHRPNVSIIGRLLQESGAWLVAPEDKRYGQDILIPRGGLGTANPGDIQGKVVVVQLTEPPALYGQPVGRITEVLGGIDDAGMEIEIAVRKYGVPHVFTDANLTQTKALPDKVLAKDKKGRIDLTDVALITIDGEDARDFDDAVYCEPFEIAVEDVADAPKAAKSRKNPPSMPATEPGWRLLVAIADVSHYVQTSSAIDADAYERATSVYFPRRVIPMLPEKLSNGLCSLNPAVERLCMVCDMVVAADGEVRAYQFYPAVMHSQARMTYNEVAAILTNVRGPEAAKRRATGFDVVPHLENLHALWRALVKARNKRGAVDFETTETQIVCDESGRIEKIIPRTRNDAHKIIEEAMLAANVCSADFIAVNAHPSLFRVHEGPTPAKQEALKQYLRTIGVPATLSDEPRPSEFAAIAHATKDRVDALQIHTMLLRSMSQAVYTPVNNGHFGLAYEAYTHFTSPIRRYPDLLVHRVIKAILAAGRYRLPQLPALSEGAQALARRMALRNKQNADALSQRGGGQALIAAGKAAARAAKASAAAGEQADVWSQAGLHCSANERRADEASKDVEAWLKCRYMKGFLGEEFGGSVATATSFGLFVLLDEMFVEGLVHISELGGDYWKYDEARAELRGERTGMRYGIGTRVRVQVSRVDLDGRKIDFRLVREGEDRSQDNPRSKTKPQTVDSAAAAPAERHSFSEPNPGRGKSATFASPRDHAPTDLLGRAQPKRVVRDTKAPAKKSPRGSVAAKKSQAKSSSKSATKSDMKSATKSAVKSAAKRTR